MPTTFTTTLPDVAGFALNNGVEDEITASWTDTINYGAYRVQHKETSASTWIDDGTVGQDTTSLTIPNLEDGEAYDVRVRSETEHVTGTYQAASITTVFPTPTNVSVDSVGQTSATLSWDDNSDNEDGFEIQHRRQYADGSFGAWKTGASVPPNTTSGTDDTLQPGADYELRVRAFTEDAENVSSVVTATTTPLDVPAQATGSSGYQVKINHPSGDAVRPAILEGVEYRPTVNGLPRIRLPVRPDDSWLSPNWEGQDLTVWFNGARLPIDTLVDVEPAPDRYVLIGRGGSDLVGRVREEFQSKEAHLAAEDIIQAAGLAANVDDPAAAVSEDLLQSASTTADWEDIIGNIPDDVPAEIANGQLQLQQSLFFGEFENFGFGGDRLIADDYSNGEAVRALDANDDCEIEVTTEYPIPVEDLRAKVREQTPNDGNPEYYVRFDGYVVAIRPANSLSQENTPTWTEYGIQYDPEAGGTDDDGDPITGVPYQTLQPGTYTLEIDIQAGSGGGDPMYFDCAAVYDDGSRSPIGGISYTFDNTVTNDTLDGPEKFPDHIEIQTVDAPSSFGIIGGRLASQWTSTANNQAVAISPDDGATWYSASNATSVEQDFGSSFADIRARFTLSRYGTNGSSTPSQGYQGQAVDSFSLYADIDETPLLIDQTFDGRGADVLTSIAEYGDFLWEVTWDRDAGQQRVEWTTPGQRTTDAGQGVGDFEVSKSGANAYKKVVIYGGGQTVESESVTASAGAWAQLDNADLVKGSEVVRDGSGTVYTAGDDYELRRQSGEIKALSTGGIADGQSLEVDYRYKPRGSAETGDYTAGEDQVLREDIPALTDVASCDQAALYLLRNVSEPQYSARVTLPQAPSATPLVEARVFQAVPTNGERLEVRDVTRTPAGTQVELGSRQSAGDLVAALQRRLGQVVRRS
jgi:hypothetical protein